MMRYTHSDSRCTTPPRRRRCSPDTLGVRFAFNQCLRLVTDALNAKRGPQVKVPWSRFDLINAYNAWKGSQALGEYSVASRDGTISEKITGLAAGGRTYRR